MAAELVLPHLQALNYTTTRVLHRRHRSACRRRSQPALFWAQREQRTATEVGPAT